MSLEFLSFQPRKTILGKRTLHPTANEEILKATGPSLGLISPYLVRNWPKYLEVVAQ
jgi:hypothetical protein